MNQILLSVIAEGGPGNTGPDFGKASPVGLLVIVLLVIATLFLVRSMNQQLKKVPSRSTGITPSSTRQPTRAPTATDRPDHRDPRMSPANPSGTNTLALATSPYLRQHADNPVHWQQWTPQALAEAAARAVPILLSVATPPATGVTSWPTSHSTTTRWPRP